MIISCKTDHKQNYALELKYHEIAQQYYDADNFDTALIYYSKIINLNSSDCLSLKRRGKCYINLGLYIKAITDIEKVIKLDCEKLADAYNDIGFSLGNLEEYEKAIPYFNKAITIDPTISYYYTNRGRCKILINPSDMKGACLDYKIAESLNDSLDNPTIDSICADFL